MPKPVALASGANARPQSVNTEGSGLASSHPPLADEDQGKNAAARATGWRAELALRYERRGARTVLAERRHAGPLLVQKALYPEGADVCHGIVLHPPGGIVGGDELTLSVEVGGRAHALLTTPGATKWYRSAGDEARQAMRFVLAPGASLEWLPQPMIAFDRTLARSECEIVVDEDACCIGWEVLCLGRTASGERLCEGRVSLTTKVVRGGVPLFIERALIEGGSRLLDSPLGLDGQPVSGTLLAVASNIDPAVVTACRAIKPSCGAGGVTRLPGLIVARYLGDRAEAAFGYFVRLWEVLRPALLDREAAAPRIWRT